MCFEQIFHNFSKFIFSFTASPLEPYKQGRSASSSKSSLIPFPRVGRRSDPLWTQKSFQRGTPPPKKLFPCVSIGFQPH